VNVRAVDGHHVARVTRPEVDAPRGGVHPLLDANVPASAPTTQERDRPCTVDEAARGPPAVDWFEPGDELVAAELVAVGAVPARDVEARVEAYRWQPVEVPARTEGRIAASGRVAKGERWAQAVAAGRRGDGDAQAGGAAARVDVGAVGEAQLVDLSSCKRQRHG
jgi:hypothetical protein